MSKNTNHPSDEQLSAFALGQLPAIVAKDVEDHISQCNTCCETMMNLADDDTFVDLVQRVGSTESGIGKDGEDTIPVPLQQHPRYQCEELVGRGGMGRVYKARHRMMDRAVALKVIHAEWVRKQEAIDRFRREVKTAASLDHPNIVTAHDAEQAGDLHLLVMEYVDGVDLAQDRSEKRSAANWASVRLRSPGCDRSAVRTRSWHGASRHQAAQLDGHQW